MMIKVLKVFKDFSVFKDFKDFMFREMLSEGLLDGDLFESFDHVAGLDLVVSGH